MVSPLKAVLFADTGVMQALHKNGNLLFEDFQDFPAWKQHLP